MSEEKINKANKIAAASLIIGVLTWAVFILALMEDIGDPIIVSVALAGIGLLLSLIAYFMGSTHRGNLILGFFANLIFLIALFLLISLMSKLSQMHC